jgi:hypothetical protein
MRGRSFRYFLCSIITIICAVRLWRFIWRVTDFIVSLTGYQPAHLSVNVIISFTVRTQPKHQNRTVKA